MRWKGARRSWKSARRGSAAVSHICSRIYACGGLVGPLKCKKWRTTRSKGNLQSEVDGMQIASYLRLISISPLPIPAGWYAMPLGLIVRQRGR
jgi:hypothetical protein